PSYAKRELDCAIERLSKNDGQKLVLALNYGSRDEIITVAKRIGTMVANGEIKPGRINFKTIEDNLYTKGIPDPDLLIRTSGELRISNFLLWQMAYTEFYITETLWPDFSRVEFFKAVLEYQKRDRRFGCVKASS
ncbi:TPA: di-trans,poly-cis-decaprenylcistransferase, partial [bacterium]|nr:di-trans,poly-cis-decaprenylcistransferase [bacterium]